LRRPGFRPFPELLKSRHDEKSAGAEESNGWARSKVVNFDPRIGAYRVMLLREKYAFLKKIYEYWRPNVSPDRSKWQKSPHRASR
jgi:hypothetical protein